MASRPPNTTSMSPEPSAPPPGVVPDGSQLPPEQWAAMQDILNVIYNYRTADGYDPSKAFHKKVNKRLVPAYYDVIKEPIALSTIKAKLQNKEYPDFTAFVRDFALIFHNAQVFNRPDAGAFQDAILLREQLEYHLQKYVVFKIITTEQATLPYLGELPSQDNSPAADDDEEEDDEEEDEDESDEDDDEDDADEKHEGQIVKRGRGRPKGSTKAARESIQSAKDLAKTTPGQTKKHRRRPPKIHTPIEARVQAVLKAMRKPKTSSGLPMIHHFERLPDRATLPDYYDDIAQPMAYDIMRKHKRRKYASLDDFMTDVDLMFNNAKQYNKDDSDIFKDAVQLQTEAHRVADQERKKPDSEYVMEEGRIPMPNGILHNGEHFRVGDWVLIQNANDLSKPIPAHIYRTYRDPTGQDWVNACWYYRPEQTVHRFDKHFFENEIMKTGQYKDHRVDEIVGRCFVMFVTRYFKGRPKHLAPGTPVFIAEARYNEEKATFNKVKTWASCLPDEVRDKDYEMDLFPEPQKMRKFPSPIAHLLPTTAKKSDPLPKLKWGAKNAPPIVGAVHIRPRDPSRDSLPPEPTPEPEGASASRPTTGHQPFSPNGARYAQSGSPAPGSSSYPTSMRPTPPPSTPGAGALSRASTLGYGGKPPQPNQYTRRDTGGFSGGVGGATGAGNFSADSIYKGPPPIETYTLSDTVDATIPDSIRARFQRDDQGRILFFTTPPLYLSQPQDADSTVQMVQMGLSGTETDVAMNGRHRANTDADTMMNATGDMTTDAATTKTSQMDARRASKSILLGHSIRYTAAKIRRGESLKRRRGVGDESRRDEQSAEMITKRARIMDQASALGISELDERYPELGEAIQERLVGVLSADLVALGAPVEV